VQHTGRQFQIVSQGNIYGQKQAGRPRANIYPLSTALREVIPMIDFLQELVDAGFHLNLEDPVIKCKAFKDNEGALEMTR
jgi:hypothetical protein